MKLLEWFLLIEDIYLSDYPLETIAGILRSITEQDLLNVEAIANAHFLEIVEAYLNYTPVYPKIFALRRSK